MQTVLGITSSLRLSLHYTLCVICIAWTDHIKDVDLRTGCHMHRKERCEVGGKEYCQTAKLVWKRFTNEDQIRYTSI